MYSQKNQVKASHDELIPSPKAIKHKGIAACATESPMSVWFTKAPGVVRIMLNSNLTKKQLDEMIRIAMNDDRDSVSDYDLERIVITYRHTLHKNTATRELDKLILFLWPLSLKYTVVIHVPTIAQHI